MGERLVSYYAYAGRKGGLVLQMKLAMKTLMASEKARTVPDSPENIERFRQILKELLPDEPEIPHL